MAEERGARRRYAGNAERAREMASGGGEGPEAFAWVSQVAEELGVSSPTAKKVVDECGGAVSGRYRCPHCGYAHNGTRIEMGRIGRFLAEHVDEYPVVIPDGLFPELYQPEEARRRMERREELRRARR